MMGDEASIKRSNQVAQFTAGITDSKNRNTCIKKIGKLRRKRTVTSAESLRNDLDKGTGV
jgi:hypothetical protein